MMLIEQEMVTISKKEYEDMLDDLTWLTCLEDAGVDNWSGYEYAIQLLKEMKEANGDE
jgi:hypothetical protein